MFPYVLVVIAFGTGEPPEPIATFVLESNCHTVAGLLNSGFKRNDVDKKAVCVNALKNGEI